MKVDVIENSWTGQNSVLSFEQRSDRQGNKTSPQGHSFESGTARCHSYARVVAIVQRSSDELRRALPESYRDQPDLLLLTTFWLHAIRDRVPIKITFGNPRAGGMAELVFRGAKQKIFSLSSSHGLDLVQHIRDQIRAQSSEYRLLPVVPATGTEMASRALLATPDAKLQVDALRKADAVSVRRLGLALLLRDLEIFSFDLQPSSWDQIRSEFYDLVHRHALSPEGFFDFSNYLPRVFGLMLACNDFDAAGVFIQRVAGLVRLLRRTTNLGQKAQVRSFRSCVDHLAKALKQAAIQASTRRTVKIDTRLLRTMSNLRKLDPTIVVPSTTVQMEKLVRQVLLADCGNRPYKDYWYLDQSHDELGPSIPRERRVRRRLRIGGIRRFRKLSAGLKVPHWPALVFPTRPMRVDEICLVAPAVRRKARVRPY